jgi:hypothetical protein
VVRGTRKQPLRTVGHIQGEETPMPEMIGHGLDSGLEHDIPAAAIYQHDGPRAGRSADYCAG